MNNPLTHRSFVSYIDKSRVFYQTHGNERAYGWAHFDEEPFSPLAKPLAECRIGVVTTADKAPQGSPREDKLFVAANADFDTLFTEKSWEKEATHTKDPDSYLPITRLGELAEQGLINSLSPRFYGVPTDFSQRLTLTQDAPQIETWMREDEVDAALLIPL